MTTLLNEKNGAESKAEIYGGNKRKTGILNKLVWKSEIIPLRTSYLEKEKYQLFIKTGLKV